MFLYFQYELSCLNFSCIQYFGYLTIWTVGVLFFFSCSALLCFVPKSPRWTCHCCICFAQTKHCHLSLCQGKERQGWGKPQPGFLSNSHITIAVLQLLSGYLLHPSSSSQCWLLPLIVLTFLCTLWASTAPPLCCFQGTCNKGERGKGWTRVALGAQSAVPPKAAFVWQTSRAKNPNFILFLFSSEMHSGISNERKGRLFPSPQPSSWELRDGIHCIIVNNIQVCTNVWRLTLPRMFYINTKL